MGNYKKTFKQEIISDLKFYLSTYKILAIIEFLVILSMIILIIIL